MLFLLFLLVLVRSGISVGSGNYDYGKHQDHIVLRRQMSAVQSKIVSALPYNGSIPLRPNIRDLEKNYEQWNLYLLALNWMQWINQTDPFSWYGITGIHGSPFVDWENVTASPGNEEEGYCPHVSIIFPTWHRPFLALFEQTMYGIVQVIASWYPEDRREVFQKAALGFRIPYWDWAAKPPTGDTVFPQSVGGSPDVRVDGPNGNQTISNPLYSYIFKPLNASAFVEFPFMYWDETKRRPMPLLGINATSNDSWVSNVLNIGLPTYQQRLHNLFSNYGNYSTWSNEAWIPDNNNGTYDSIESLHDDIHLACGGNYGHMAIIAYSAFDPVFFLHHANIDRIFAIWQLIHNDSYITAQPALLATRTISAGSIQDENTDLTPFFYNKTTFWNSKQVRNHTVFGYSYAEVVNGSRNDAIALVNRLYTDYSPVMVLARSRYEAARKDYQEVRSRKTTHGSLENAECAIETNTKSEEKSLPVPLSEIIFRDGVYREWLMNVRLNKHGLNASYSVYVFFGSVPQQSSQWQFASSMVGSMGVFAGKKANASGPHISGVVPLTSALIRLVNSGALPGLGLEVVEAFLKNSLEVRIAYSNGTAIEPWRVPGLSINVVSFLVKAPESEEELAQWGDMSSSMKIF
ncbi:hypothetical protein BX600DRAFT_432181 [Xylariales sp. PMI_506]|nr:hypothetical protein BX600DRAFT_432181 [Xylariales sp. PMI_506]